MQTLACARAPIRVDGQCACAGGYPRWRIIGVVLVTLLAMAPQASGTNWLMYLWDLTHSSFNPRESVINQANVATLHPQWQINLGQTIATGMTIVDGVAYVGDWNGNFSALNIADGTLRWQAFVGLTPAQPDCDPATAGVSSQAVVQGGAVYVGGGDAAVYALDIASGALLWRVSLGDIADGAYLWSSLMLYRKALYIGIASFGDCPLTRGGLARIDLSHPTTPLIRYFMPKGRVGAGVWSTPAIDPGSNTVLVTTGNGVQHPRLGAFGSTMLKLDAGTLATQAYYLLPTNSTVDDIEWGSSPTLVPTAEGRTLVLATAKDGRLYAQDLRDLSPVWQTTVAIGGSGPQSGEGAIATPAFDGQRVYVGAGRPPDGSSPGSLYAIDPPTGAVLWMQALDGTVLAPPTVANGLVYTATLTGLHIFDAPTGELLWQDPTGTSQYGQVAVVDGVVYATYVDGSVRAWTVDRTP